jgi:hypothetical protein
MVPSKAQTPQAMGDQTFRLLFVKRRRKLVFQNLPWRYEANSAGGHRPECSRLPCESRFFLHSSLHSPGQIMSPSGDDSPNPSLQETSAGPRRSRTGLSLVDTTGPNLKSIVPYILISFPRMYTLSCQKGKMRRDMARLSTLRASEAGLPWTTRSRQPIPPKDS